MKKLTTLLFAGLFSLALLAQSDPRIARTKAPLADVPLALMPHLDNAALMAAELERRAPGIAPKFAVPHEVSISPATHGRWDLLPNGNALWRLRIRSSGAKSLNLGFTKYLMPDRGSLVLYSPDFQEVMGPFTPADNEEHEQLWTPVLPGDELVVEVQVPASQQSALQLELKYVNHDFAGFAEMASGSCNLDVVCGAADGFGIVDAYRDIIQSVAVISTGGGTFCTGFLVNNARQDCAPMFMTAFHCGIGAGDAPSLVTYWNFQNSTCRQPNSPASGGGGDGQLNDFNTGSTFRAGGGATDFTLVELDDPVSETANAYFAGWNATGIPQDTSICIHHPSTDEKRITFDFNPAEIGNWDGSTPDHWYVDWDLGITEPGSSGSPLFDEQHRVVGQLHGGPSSCTSADKHDLYGMFHLSWVGAGTPATRLSDWLDPDNTGVLAIGGRSALQCSFFVEGSPATQSLCAPADAVYTVTASANFSGPVTLSTANLPAGLTATFATNPVSPGGSTTLTVSGTAAVAEGSYTFSLSGTDGTESNSNGLQLSVASQTPAPPALTFPTDGAAGIGLTPIYAWAAPPSANYGLEIALDAAFTNLVETASNLTTGSYTTTLTLAPTTTYYWRVRGENVCGLGNWPAAPSSFETGAVTCAPTASADVPVAISDEGQLSVTSTLVVAIGGFVDDVNLTNLSIEHTYVGDLRVALTSPSGTTITLFTNPGSGGCSNNDLQISLDDEATATNDELLNMCNDTPPAIMGSFQPGEPLSIFNGEPASGTWTMTVYDDADADGGFLLGWGLDLCSTIPNDFSLTPSSNSLTSCLGTELAFNLSLGTAFDEASGVTLSAANLPAGAAATFAPNPAPPGAQVAVTVSGGSTVGSFNFEVVGTDGSGGSGTTTLLWNVLGTPAAPTAIAPAQGATGVGLNPVLSWSAVAGSSAYTLRVANDPGMANILFMASPQQAAQILSGLEPCTTYFWTVAATSLCGVSAPGTVYGFTTLNDLTFNATPAVSACPTGTASVTLNLGECFGAGGVTLAATGLPSGASINFPQNPAPAGSTQAVTVNLANATSGSYTVTLTGSDGANNVVETFVLNVTALAAAPVMVAPANAATGVNVLAAFDWNTVPGASSYQLEVATDASFANIAFSTTLTQTDYTPPTPLNVNTTYHWRVRATNNCGLGTVPTPFSFTTWLVNGVDDLNGLTVSILPNPTSGLLNVLFSKPSFENMDASLYAVNGVLLKNQVVQIGSKSATFDLSELPSGVYLLRLRSGSGVLTKKIIKE